VNGNLFSCALTAAQTVWCWGYGANGHLGVGATGDTLHPVQVVGLSGVTKISAGLTSTCALLTTHTVKCWGENGVGQLGDGSTSPFEAMPQPVGVGTSVVDISVGGNTACAVTAGGQVWCWGSNATDALGQGNASPTFSAIPLMQPTLPPQVTSVAVGDGFVCVTMTSSGPECWGADNHGQTGNGSITTVVPFPVGVTGGLSDVTSIDAGESSTCAVRTGGDLECWGLNANGELGNGSTLDVPAPVQVNGLNTGVAAVGIGNAHACATLTTGGARCWGDGSRGQLGWGSMIPSATPVVVTNITSIAPSVSAGGDTSCAVQADTTVRCWGHNDHGQVGAGSIGQNALGAALVNY
jgi:alpha-tubulin suppressor-like RCC1 family protein